MVRNLVELGPNMQKMLSRLMNNQDLMKLLYYTDKDPLSKKDFSKEEIKEKIYEKLIKIVPKIEEQEKSNSIVAFRVMRGIKNATNNEFQDIAFEIEVIVPLSQWKIKGENLRPFAIISEIQKSLNNKLVDGFGRIVGGDFELEVLTDEISTYVIHYGVISYE